MIILGGAGFNYKALMPVRGRMSVQHFGIQFGLVDSAKLIMILTAKMDLHPQVFSLAFPRSFK